MGQYIITIVPVADDDFAGPVAQTTVRIETDNGRPAVTELIMRAPGGSGLVNGELPYVDFETLLRAFVPNSPDSRDSTDSRDSPDSDAEPAPRERPTPKAAQKKAATPSRASGARSTGSRSTGSRSTGATVSHLPAGRAYRRAPEVEELEAAYAEAGSIARVADHFGVPVHTAQGWISRLRRRNTAEANT
jgi:hypothetical protein